MRKLIITACSVLGFLALLQWVTMWAFGAKSETIKDTYRFELSFLILMGSCVIVAWIIDQIIRKTQEDHDNETE